MLICFYSSNSIVNQLVTCKIISYQDNLPFFALEENIVESSEAFPSIVIVKEKKGK